MTNTVNPSTRCLASGSDASDEGRRQALPRRVPARRSRESRIRYGGSFRTRREAHDAEGLDRRRARRAARPRPRLLEREPPRRRRSPRPPSGGAPPASTSPSRRECCTASRSIACCRSSARVASTSSSPPTSPRWSPRCRDGLQARRRSARASGSLAQMLDHAGVDPNPARDQVQRAAAARGARRARAADRRARRGRLSDCSRRCTAAAAVARLVGRAGRLGRRLLVGDYDEPRRRVRLRASIDQDPPGALGRAARRARRRDRGRRSARARIATRRAAVRGLGRGRARTAIAKACRAPGSRCSRRTTCVTGGSRCCIGRGASWAEIGAFVGQRSARVTSDVYTHVLLDDREVDYRALLTDSA